MTDASRSSIYIDLLSLRLDRSLFLPAREAHPRRSACATQPSASAIQSMGPPPSDFEASATPQVAAKNTQTSKLESQSLVAASQAWRARFLLLRVSVGEHVSGRQSYHPSRAAKMCARRSLRPRPKRKPRERLRPRPRPNRRPGEG